MNPFKREDDFYKRNLDPIKNYVKQASIAVSKKKNISITEAKELVKNKLKNSNIKIPTVTYYDKDKNGDRVEKKTSIVNYIKEAVQKDYIIAPSFTRYVQPDKFESVYSGFTMMNLEARNKEKKTAKNYLMNKNIEKFNIHNTLQLSRKTFNNSLSGAFVSKNFMQTTSNHYTLTSVTRMAASLGNALTEHIVSGNRMYFNIDLIYNNIVTLLSDIDKEEFDKTIKNHNLVYPTTDDIMAIIKRSSDMYFNDDEGMKKLRNFIDKLTGLERAIIAYTNDLYHVRKLNPNCIRTMIDNFSKITVGYSDIDLTIEKFEPYVELLAKFILYDKLKGVKLELNKIKGTPLYDEFISTMVNIKVQFKKYGDLIQTFLVTNVFPINIARMKDMTRKCIVLSDTDSTCGSYGEWSTWFLGKPMIGGKGTAIAAVIMTMVAESLSHYLYLFTTQLGVKGDMRGLLQMKNEFYWSVYVPLNISKHYYSYTCAKEGFVFEKPEIEKKGKNLIASDIPMEYQKKLNDMMVDILDTIHNNKKISILKYVKYVADLERDVSNKIHNFDKSIFKLDKIKDSKAYKVKQPEKTPYYHYMLWEEVFAEKYGNAPKPQITAYKINTTLKDKKTLDAFIETIKDESIKEKFKAFQNKYPKNGLGMLRLPAVRIDSVGLPDEIKSIIDEDKMIKNILSGFYMVLESLGFIIKENSNLIKMGY